MTTVQISLFSEFQIVCNGKPVVGLDARKARDLFCYLALYRNRSHTREFLANLLWGYGTSAQARKGLRQVLWQLQSVLEPARLMLTDSILIVDNERVRLNIDAGIWLDVEQFEYVVAQVHDLPGRAFDPDTCAVVRTAVDLYRGDLLEDCYYDWCLYERERLQSLYLGLLDKLMEYSEANHDYEAGLDYGRRVLRCDQARERTYQQLMVMEYQAGNRIAALRHYDRCVQVLHNELGVAPAQRTTDLYRRIQADQLGPDTPIDTSGQAHPAAHMNNQLAQTQVNQAGQRASLVSAQTNGHPFATTQILEHLDHLMHNLSELHCEIQNVIKILVETIQNDAKHPADQ